MFTKSVGIGVLTGIAYGLLLRVGGEAMPIAFSVMSMGFLFLGPFAIGWVTIYFSKLHSISALKAFFLPSLAILAGCLAASALKFEGLICIVMYLPAGILLSGIGGLLALRTFSRLPKNQGIYAVMLLPFVSQLAEGQFQAAKRFHDVHNVIEIRAQPHEVWNAIKSVPTITREEMADSWVHLMGFPRPLDAQINIEGLGGVRQARFERGLVFKETVNVWEPGERLGFDIDVDPLDIPPTALDQHVTIGGPFFDVLHGEYRIERVSETVSRLHLESQFKLSTHFNFYSGLWTSLVMHQIQSDILHVLQSRVERSK